MECVATGFKPITECRRHVYNIVCKTPGDNKKVNWREAEQKKQKEKTPDPSCPHCKGSGGVKVGEDEYSTCPCVGEWKPASPEHVDKCVKEFNQMLANAPMLQRHSGYKQLIEERGWDKRKPTPYPPTSIEEAYIKARHLAYIKANYEPRTGKPLPTWKPEHEWNTEEL
jgi:hypothetical protein